jgi:diguanylate cyclase (GGDEF)-like protein
MFFIAIVVVPLGMAGVVVQAAIHREVDHRTDIRVQGDSKALAVAWSAEGSAVAQRVSRAAADVGGVVEGGSASASSLMASLDAARQRYDLDFLIITPSAGGSVRSVGPSSYLGPEPPIGADQLATPGAAAPLVIGSTVPLDLGGAQVARVAGGVFVDQPELRTLGRTARGVRAELLSGGRVVASSLLPAVPLPPPRSGAVDLPAGYRGRFVPLAGGRLTGPGSSGVAVLAQQAGDVAFLRDEILLVLFGGIAVASLLGYGLAQRISEPLRRLAQQASSVLPGEEAAKLPGDEVDALATSFEAITDHLHRAEERSLTDVLTGARNRRFLEITLPHEVERARRYGRDLSVLMADVDRFKHVNDEFGHHRGDEVLVEVARRLAASVRKDVDTIVRHGGDEFVVLLPETDRDGAVAAAERVRTLIAEAAVGSEDDGAISVTVSVGVASLPGDGPTASDLLRSADLAMYRAKQLGGDRVSWVTGAAGAR